MAMTVTVRQVNRVCQAAQVLIVAIALWVLVDGLLLREPLPKPDLHAVAAKITGRTTSAVDMPALEDWSAIWQRDLRQRLIDPPPPPKPEPPAPKPPPNPPALPRLLATFVEHQVAWALFVDSGGRQRVRSVGERIDSFEIARITPGIASLQMGRHTYEVKVPQGPKTGRPWRRGG